MTCRDLASLLAYDRWATRRLLDAADNLSPEQYTYAFGEGFASVQGTLAHVIGAGALWLRRWQEAPPSGRPAWIDDPSRETLRRHAEAVAAGQQAFLATCTDDDLGRTIRYTLLSGAAGDGTLETLVLHAVNHGTHHRGQVATMLRRLGTVPPALDLLLFPGV